MFGKILSADVRGIEGYEVSVEVDISDGMPVFLMVGYLAAEVREAADRVRTALRNCGIHLPPKRITVNLAPAGVRKSGSKFDLPVAAALLMALNYLPEHMVKQVMMIGELSLNGEIHPVPGVLPMVEAARNLGCKSCIVPLENVREASLIRGIRVLGIRHLNDLLEGQLLDHQRMEEQQGRSGKPNMKAAEYGVDFSEVNGQENVKRAAQVAVAGRHNFLMIGPPGSGKTMIAKCIPTILPPLTREEQLEISKIYSIAGLLSGEEPFVWQRPFRAPHHTTSGTALTGGGRVPMPGEISLASHGVLFLDELPEFKKSVLEVLRQPLEEQEIRICRSYGTYVYPADFMLVAAMNPCSCGYYPDRNLCSCTEGEAVRYLHRISQPLLDRMDVCTEAPRITYEELTEKGKGESSEQIRNRMIKVHQIQKERYKGTQWHFNAQLNGAGIEQFCPLEKKEQELLKNAFEKLGLSARAYHRILKVARTIADLEESDKIQARHLMEAICYRSLDKKYWMR